MGSPQGPLINLTGKLVARRSRLNPFYVVLVVVGIAFTITASAYGVMAFTDIRGGEIVAGGEDRPPPSAWGEATLAFMREHGDLTMLIELALLAAATFLAIGTDDYWSRDTAGKSLDTDPPGESRA